MPKIVDISLGKAHEVYVEWFEPGSFLQDFEKSARDKPKLGRVIDLFPDPNKDYYAGIIEIHKDSQTRTWADVVNGIGLEAGTSSEIRVELAWERETLETKSTRFLLNLKSFEEASMTRI